MYDPLCKFSIYGTPALNNGIISGRKFVSEYKLTSRSMHVLDSCIIVVRHVFQRAVSLVAEHLFRIEGSVW